MRRQESPLHLGVIGEARRLAEELLVDLEPYCRLVVRSRHEDALVRRDAHAKYRRSVEIGEEDQDVVLIVVALEILEQRRTPRTLLPQPLDLVVARVRAREDPLGVAIEGVDVAGTGVGEASDRHATDAIGAFGILVLPRDVVRRARRQHFDLMLRREPLGNQPAVVLGAAKNLGAVALDDESYLQRSLSVESVAVNCASMRSGAKSWRRCL